MSTEHPPPEPPTPSPASAASVADRPAAFPRTARLLTPADFGRVQSQGRTFDLGPVVVRVARLADAATGPAPARLGLAVSRRVGNAVARNHVKRRVREWFRHRRAALAGCDLVVTARPAAATLDQAALSARLDELLRRLGRPAPGSAP